MELIAGDLGVLVMDYMSRRGVCDPYGRGRRSVLHQELCQDVLRAKEGAKKKGAV